MRYILCSSIDRPVVRLQAIRDTVIEADSGKGGVQDGTAAALTAAAATATAALRRTKRRSGASDGEVADA